MTALKLYQNGYTDIVSVIPPGAELSPLSKVKPESAGKAPGRKNSQGRWVGYGWQAEVCSEADAVKMDADHANIGLKAGKFPGVDIDCTDEQISLLIERLSLKILGVAPVRIGQAPKRLLMYRCDEPFARMRLWFRVAEKQHLIEVLGEGQQYVVSGIHPRTQKPYEWHWGERVQGHPPIKPPKLTHITKEDVGLFLAAVQDELDLFDIPCQREGSGNVADKRVTPQESLKARDLDQLALAVSMTPNDTPSRDDFIKMGYAIKAASQEDEERGYGIFLEWCERWAGGQNDPFSVRLDWERMKPPFELGADWIYDQAAAHGFNSAATEFDAIEQEDEDAEALIAAELSDIWVTERFLTKHGAAVRWVPAWGKFLVWNGQCWRRDDMQKVPSMVVLVCKEVADKIMREGATDREKAANQRKAVAVCSARTVAAVQNLIKLEGSIIAPAEMMDADPWVLGTPGGTVDLKTGEILSAEPMRFVTKLTAITPLYRHEVPLWRSFLAEATGNDKELEAYLQRLAGYCLTGMVTEHNLAFLWGPGGNGKSVFVNTISGIMGEYAKTAPMATFTASFNDRHPTELAGLQGARLVTASETQEGRAWDEAKVKAITGGDPISARYMREDFFTYAPTFKLVFLGNHKPTIENLDEAMRRRFHLVPFIIKPRQIDQSLSDKLKAEWPAIFGWMIDGVLAWQQVGLAAPQAVLDATKQYFEDEDPVGRWMEDRCQTGEGESVLLKSLFYDWEEWCLQGGEKRGSNKRFAQLVFARGFTKARAPGTGLTTVYGISLRGSMDITEATRLLAHL